MDFTQIKYFLAVAKTLNFTRAADECAVSQPALSKAIKKLEDNLGSNLFDRNSQKVVLTEFGQTMRIHFERIEDNLRKARSAANAAANSTGESLNIGVMCTIGPKLFSKFLKSFHTSHSHIDVTLHDITATAIPELLLTGSLDCIFCAKTEKLDPRFEIINLLEEQMVIAFSNDHHFNSLETVSLAKISSELYLDRLHCEFRDDFLNFTKARGLSLNVAISSEREDWILDLITQGLGVCVIPKSSAVLHSVANRPISDMTDLRKLKLVLFKKTSPTSALSAFRNAALEFEWN